MATLSTRIRRARRFVKPAAVPTAAAAQEPTLEVVAARVASHLSPEQRWRFEATKEWWRARPKINTVDDMRAASTPDELRAIVAVFGSLEEFRAVLVMWIEREAVFPTPDEMHVHPDGSIKLLW